jgi:hypothetical protein
MLIQILAVVLVLVAGIVVIALLQPSDFRVMRSIIINASPAAIFPYTNDLHKWNEWSPWANLDPNCERIYEGPVEGVGAVFHWKGNKKVGEGIMTIFESTPNDVVKMRLEFLKPFKAINTAEFAFKSEGVQTNVTWSMHGRNKLIGKIMSLVMNCDKMVGPQFEKGLATLKSIVESK